MAASSSSKLLQRFTSSFLLLHRRRSRSTPLSLLRLCSSSSSSVAAAGEAEASSAASSSLAHPWPEWDQFLEKMKSKGYFHRTIETAAGDDKSDGAGGGGGEAVSGGRGFFSDQNRVKNACLTFARERFDILRSLPKGEIKTVVECGCPNLMRKTVNSAKRLRAFLKLDEGDVCGACSLRGSCDRAYAIATEDEGACTVDVMRILMTYSVDPVLRSGVANPSIKDHVHESARKLLAELTKLSDTTVSPDLPAPAAQHSGQKEPSQKSQITNRNKPSQDVEMKKGDWLCPRCKFLNFARNVRCLKCKEDGPKRVNFGDTEMKLGDWSCPQCEFMNFARNKKCFRCQESRPERELNPGEWECPSCDFVNFRGNKVCKKCNQDRPEDDTSSHFGDRIWRTTKKVKENKDLTFGDMDDEDEEDLDDGDDDILPLQEGESNFVPSKRAVPAERKFTSARKKNSPWL
ncbi:zinc finger protein VAR3, chloroplastic [Iris pallida]|uniref:Zinc finger protein VAR3, chloroplastic n=1 Tax=Iris pallida TaxID=29817 RepID=A0AAX6HT94_IRIPA|nr:zinc finger protein VAR3, chloroplastic [Iris pallida]